MQDYHIGIIGTQEAIAGFAGIGVIPLGIQSDEDIGGIIKKIEDGKFAAIFITEDWAKRIRESIDKAFAKKALPAILTVPSPHGASEEGLSQLKKIVEQAVGSDILSK